MVNDYVCPVPIIDKKESDSLDELTERYNKIIEPSKAKRMIRKAENLVPGKIKQAGTSLGKTITEQELYQQTLELISSGFNTVVEIVSKYTIISDAIVKNVSKSSKDVDISTIDEICLIRSYDIAKAVNKSKEMSCFYADQRRGNRGGMILRLSF